MAKGSKKKASKRPSTKKKVALDATTADRHALYQLSVQAPEFEVELLGTNFEQRAGRAARTLREDFCGTALLCAEWVKSDDARHATGIDIDGEVLAWGREHNLAPLGDAAARVNLIEGDVREPRSEKYDIVCAFNYSYWYIKDRPTLLAYFRSVKDALEPGGLFFLDLFGGWEAVQVMEEERKYKDFRYVWDQASFNPIDHAFVANIHFRFKDGSALEPAFTYDWRMWTLPELRDLLEEAGFATIECLWEDENDVGEGTGEYRPQTKVRNDPAFNAYLVAGLPRAARPKAKTKKKPKKART